MDPVSTNGIAASQGSSSTQLGYGSTLADNAADFEASLEAAQLRVSTEPNTAEAIAKAAMEPLNFINQEAQALSDYAQSSMASGNELTPSEIVNLTVQSQKFMFHSQLTANVANRSADGVQQLFRQQG
ncbi:MAG: hypothetical protein AAF404_08955 [Pseudomonadota bacterium]